MKNKLHPFYAPIEDSEPYPLSEVLGEPSEPVQRTHSQLWQLPEMEKDMKLIRYVHRTVTQEGWNVGCTTGSGIDGAILDVFRTHVHGKSLPVDRWVHPLGKGKQFRNTDEAWQWAFDHGYLRLFFYPELRQRRKERARDQRFLVVSGRGSYGSYDTFGTAKAAVASLASHGISDAWVVRV